MQSSSENHENHENHENQSNQIEILDGLRGIAILLVVWYHLWQLSWLSTRITTGIGTLDFDFIGRNGYLGVELFFFISAVCLTLPVLRARRRGVSPDWSEYAYRRAIKILPSYWLAITLILALGFQTFGSPREYLWQLVTHFFFIHNLFNDTRSAINGVFWSLGVEVQFYVLFPWLVQWFVRQPWGIAFGMAGVSLCYRYWGIYAHPHDLNYWNNQLPGFLDLFGAGMLTAYLLVTISDQRTSGTELRAVPRKGWSWGVAGALGFLFWLFSRADQIRYQPEQPYQWQILNRGWLALGFLVLVVATHNSSTPWRRVLVNRGLVWLSTLSYNLYIWHQFLGRELVKRGSPQRSHQILIMILGGNLFTHYLPLRSVSASQH